MRDLAVLKSKESNYWTIFILLISPTYFLGIKFDKYQEDKKMTITHGK
jgi:hypothetical protein